jgi:hypothetical protein
MTPGTYFCTSFIQYFSLLGAFTKHSVLGTMFNDELDELIRHKNIINHIKAQKLSWFGHLHRISEERMVKKSVYVETDVNMTTRKTK